MNTAWRAKFESNEGLRRTVEWCLENQDWAEGVITGEYRGYYQKVYGREWRGQRR